MVFCPVFDTSKKSEHFFSSEISTLGKFRVPAEYQPREGMTSGIENFYAFLRFELHIVEPLIEPFFGYKLFVGTLLDYPAKVKDVDRGCVFDGT